MAAELQAAPAETATTTWFRHRHPTAGNFRPVYTRYRGERRAPNRFLRWFHRRPAARHHAVHARRAPHRTL